MKKIIGFCKDNYKILIPVMVGIVLLIAMFFLYREYKYDNTRNKEEVKVFQYFGGIKNEYSAIVTYNLKNSIVDFSAKDKKIEYDSTPVYFEDSDKVLFPEEMTIVFPLRDGSQFKLYKYAMYNKEDNLHYIKNNTDKGKYNYFFLYDGIGLFYFPDDVVLNIGGEEYKKLGGSSYVSLVGGLTLIYYDKTTDSSEVIELNGRIVTVSNDNIDVNINEKYFISFGKKVLLFTPDNLKPVFKTIDN